MINVLTLLYLGILAMPSGWAALAPEEYIWWEAEYPSARNFPTFNPFAPQDEEQREKLSNRRWIGTSGEYNGTLFLEYEVPVSVSGSYHFYVRKFWKHGPFRWRFGDQAWSTVGRDIALIDSVELRQFVVANWIYAGEVELEQGIQTLRIESIETEGAMAFDCFVLTPGEFNPNGKLKPGEKLNEAPEGYFPFEPDRDRYLNSPIDLRSLNEDFAGQNGFIGVEGETFVHTDSGEPVRFWGVNCGPGVVRLDKSSIDGLARMLAKRGVNAVRHHGSVWQGNNITEVDLEYLDKIHYFVYAMKQQGIYTGLSIYFPLWMDLGPGDGFAGYTGEHPFSLPYFSEQFQEMYRGWWTTVLTTENPYTGVPLKDDPAVSCAELVNEDSYFFWTFTPYQNIPAEQMAILETQFGDWLTVKYGSVQTAFDTWGTNPIQGDDAAAGRAGFMPLWNIFNQKNLRAKDTAQFLTESQLAFYRDMTEFLKNEIGFKGVVQGSNWKTASDTILGPLDKYTNTACDYIDRHGYFGGPHQGERSSYSISEGDRYDDRTGLTFDPATVGLPIMDLTWNKLPSTISEINWTPPNRYRAEMIPLSAAYGLLQGSDGYYFFAVGGASWLNTLTKFPNMIPAVLGQFPAAAYIYRKGLVREGDWVVDVQLGLDDLYNLEGAPIAAPQNLDEFRENDIPPGTPLETDDPSSIDPVAFLVGRVGMDITPEGGTSSITELSPYVDRENKTVLSTTGELFWDYGKGVATIDAPQVQGATGFFTQAGTIQLSQIVLNTGMPYGSLLLVSMDGEPIATSSRMLLQVMTEDTNNGWQTGEPGTDGLREITDLGGPPLVVKNIEGLVQLKRPDAAELDVLVLDFNGYAVDKIEGAAYLTLREDVMYYLITK